MEDYVRALTLEVTPNKDKWGYVESYNVGLQGVTLWVDKGPTEYDAMNRAERTLMAVLGTMMQKHYQENDSENMVTNTANDE